MIFRGGAAVPRIAFAFSTIVLVTCSGAGAVERTIKLDDAGAKGAETVIVPPSDTRCKTETRAASEASVSAALILDCRDATGPETSYRAVFKIFTRMLLTEPWRVKGVTVDAVGSQIANIGGEATLLRGPSAGGVNLWTEVQVDAKPGKRILVWVGIVAAADDGGLPLTCGPRGNVMLRSGPPPSCPPCPAQPRAPPCNPAFLPPGASCPSAPPALPCPPCNDTVEGTVFNCAHNSDCAVGYRCSHSPCWGYCVPG